MKQKDNSSVRKVRVKEKSSDPLEILQMEHERGLEYAQRLQEAADDIRKHGFSTAAYSRIGEAILFIDTEMRRHNEKEEQFLLPLIEPHIPRSPQEIRREHRALWTAFQDLRRHIQDIEDGRLRGTAIIELVESASLIAEILGEHIAMENEVLFPEVKRLLNAEEYERLTKGILSATN
jgi:hemerythrin-like domain-containing protein